VVDVGNDGDIPPKWVCDHLCGLGR
jgi:hypothetical protein